MFFLKKRIYADAAASTPLSKSVRNKLIASLNLYGNPSALHREALAAKKELDEAREMTASTLGVQPQEIIFTGSGTESNNLAIQGTLRPLLRKYVNVHAITSAIEHPSVLNPLRQLMVEGLDLTEVSVDREGIVSKDVLLRAIQETTAFISIQLVNGEIGTLQSIREFAKNIRYIRKTRADAGNLLPLYFHCDASQAPLWIKLSVPSLGVDLLTLDAQKIEGPKGVGLLFVRKKVYIEPLVLGGNQERGLRSGTPSIALIGAFALAIVEAQKNVAIRVEKISMIRNFMYGELQRLLPDLKLQGPALNNRVVNNLNISIPRLDGEVAVIAMDTEGIAIATRSACATEEETASHVITALGVPSNEIQYSLRITLLPDATFSQARKIVRTLVKVAHRYRSVV